MKGKQISLLLFVVEKTNPPVSTVYCLIEDFLFLTEKCSLKCDWRTRCGVLLYVGVHRVM